MGLGGLYAKPSSGGVRQTNLFGVGVGWGAREPPGQWAGAGGWSLAGRSPLPIPAADLDPRRRSWPAAAAQFGQFNIADRQLSHPG